MDLLVRDRYSNQGHCRFWSLKGQNWASRSTVQLSIGPDTHEGEYKVREPYPDKSAGIEDAACSSTQEGAKEETHTIQAHHRAIMG